jgi:hypothetical protein
METSKNKAPVIISVVLAMFWLTGPGCEGDTSIVEPIIKMESEDAEVNFNPQPEPPPSN